MLHTLEQEQTLPISQAEAWNFFSSPANLDEITPDDLGFKITSPLAGRMFDGQIIIYRVRPHAGFEIGFRSCHEKQA